MALIHFPLSIAEQKVIDIAGFIITVRVFTTVAVN